MALPTWRHPRLIILANSARARWLGSALYPAYKSKAKAYKALLRIKALLPMGSIRRTQGPDKLTPFLESAGMDNLQPRAVLFGTKGPAQKMIIELHDTRGRTAAYLKYGESQAAIRRLSNERDLLGSLPEGLAPVPVFFSAIENGVGLLLSAVPGSPMPPRLALSGRLIRLMSTVPVSGKFSVDDHPWIAQLLSKRGDQAARWIKPLRKRKWGAVVQHGDLAPWNILIDKTGSLRIIDWEYGTLEGFPGIDLAFYVLQQAVLIYNLIPQRARERAVQQLARVEWLGLSHEEAEAIVRLTALDTCIRVEEENRGDSMLRKWWREVWGGA